MSCFIIKYITQYWKNTTNHSSKNTNAIPLYYYYIRIGLTSLHALQLRYRSIVFTYYKNNLLSSMIYHHQLNNNWYHQKTNQPTRTSLFSSFCLCFLPYLSFLCLPDGNGNLFVSVAIGKKRSNNLYIFIRR